MVSAPPAELVAVVELLHPDLHDVDGLVGAVSQVVVDLGEMVDLVVASLVDERVPLVAHVVVVAELDGVHDQR